MPYGTWPSTLTANELAIGVLRFGEPKLIGKNAVIWPQSVPSEAGRTTLMYSHNHSEPMSLLSAPWDVRSKVHEYGGGAFAVNMMSDKRHEHPSNNHAFFVNAKDQQIYRFNWQTPNIPSAITHTPQCRYANLTLHPSGEWLFAVCEDLSQSHTSPKASIVAINTRTQQQLTLAQGADFYAGLCMAPCGFKLAYICWHHPNMPWDSTELWELSWQNANLVSAPIQAKAIAGQQHSQAICQPAYSPNGHLFYVSDLHEWWNIYSSQNPQKPAVKIAADCATPQWTFGMQNWGFINETTLLISATQNGHWQLYIADLTLETFSPIPSSALSVFSHLHCANGQAVMLSAGQQQITAPTLLTLTPPQASTCSKTKLQPLLTAQPPLSAEDISHPQSHWFDTTNNEQAHLWYYPPTNSRYQAQNTAQPPLIVLGHGGPTGATETSFNSKIQYWTHRGFAVADVNYRGSTGFGRLYRQALAGQWGIKDVEDLCNAADYLAAEGLAHPEQKIIKGSSAGGYSVLAALTMRTTFNAGVSLYGIADLETLAKDTHKFEAHYLDTLIGPYPAQKALYQKRSPINNMAGLNCPILVAQGLEDKVVPPSQAELIVQAAKKKNVYVEYLSFAGEGHGFRQADTLIKLFEAELQFYARIFGFHP